MLSVGLDGERRVVSTCAGRFEARAQRSALAAIVRVRHERAVEPFGNGGRVVARSIVHDEDRARVLGERCPQIGDDALQRLRGVERGDDHACVHESLARSLSSSPAKFVR